MRKKMILTLCYMALMTLFLNPDISLAGQVSYNRHILSFTESTGKIDSNAVAAALLITLIGGISIIIERKRDDN